MCIVNLRHEAMRVTVVILSVQLSVTQFSLVLVINVATIRVTFNYSQ